MKTTIRALMLLLLLSATLSGVSAQFASTTPAASTSSTASFTQVTAAPVTSPVQGNSKKQSTTTTTAVPTTNINTGAKPASTSITTATTTTLSKPKNHLPTSLTQTLKAVAPSEQSLQARTETSTPCGKIIGSRWDRNYSQDITNCDDPFNAESTKIDSVGRFEIKGQIVSDKSTIFVPVGGTDNFLWKLFPAPCVDVSLYTYRNGDWVYQFDPGHLFEYVLPTENDYRKHFNTEFRSQAKRDRYLAVALRKMSYFDLSYEERVEYDKSMESFDELFESYRPIDASITAGEYVLVVQPCPPVYPVFNDKPSVDFIKKLKELFIPTAYAQHYYPNTVYSTLTFTVVEGDVQEDISNILFFPGIQASKLYSREEIDNFGFNIDIGDKLWTPHQNDDVRALVMSDTGVSRYDIYAGEILDKIPGGDKVYTSFESSMKDFVEKEGVQAWDTFPYDWRHDVFDIVRKGTQYKNDRVFPTEKVKEMAADSKTGKVTVIGHSNGGLLIKALMIELEKQGKTGLVDKIIFIGTPHLGTPKAIGTVLHGYGQQDPIGGLVIDDVVAREVIRNLPGVYNLLPSERYMQEIDNAVISFEDSVATQPFFAAYGSDIDSFSELQQFLINAEGNNERNAVTYHDKKKEINIPSEANWNLLPKAEVQHKLLDNWQALDGVDVYSFIGVGNLTPRSINYTNVVRKTCRPWYSCAFTNILKPSVQFSKQGDETVMSVSAEHQAGETYYIDLQSYNKTFSDDEEEPDFSHVNLTEIEQVQFSVKSILKDESFNYEYVSLEEPILNTAYNIEKTDSPVNMVATDVQGNKTGIVNGKIVEDITDSTYIEFGGSKYIITPAETDTTTVLTGTGEGSYTLTLQTLQGDTQTVDATLASIPVTPALTATYQKIDGEYSAIKNDIDSDGAIDELIELDGTVTLLAKTVKDPVGKAAGGGGATRIASAKQSDSRVLGASVSAVDVQKVAELLELLETATLTTEKKAEIKERVKVLLAQYIKQYDNQI